MLPNLRFLAFAIVTGGLLTPGPGAAQPQSDAEKMERLERQVELLQKQLKAVQDEIKVTKKKAEKVEAAQAVHATTPKPAPPPTSYETKTSYEPKTNEAKYLPSLAGVKITLGGYVAAESVFRTHNQVADMGSTFNAIPYPFSPLYGEHEFHASARGSRLSLLAEGNIDAAQKLAAYYESRLFGYRARRELHIQRLGPTSAAGLPHVRQQRSRLPPPCRPGVEPSDAEQGRDHSATRVPPIDDRLQQHGRLRLYSELANQAREGFS